MDDEQLNQRIRYLVEHGGLYDDPLAEIRRLARIGAATGVLSLAMHLAQVLL